MSFRTRVAASAAVVVAIAVLLACGAAYKGARDALRRLRRRLARPRLPVHRARGRRTGGPYEIDAETASGFGWLVVGPKGQALRPGMRATIPIDATIRAVAAGIAPTTFRTVVAPRDRACAS